MTLLFIQRSGFLLVLIGLLFPMAGFSSGLISTTDEATTRHALLGGGTVVFDSDGTIPLTQTVYIQNETTIDANGHNVVFDGQNNVQIFYVASNATLTIKGLTVRNGTDRAFYSTFSGFENTNDLVAHGGAICSFGELIAVNCRFESNSVTVGHASPYDYSPALGLAKGGAISSEGGRLALTDCVFIGNSAASSGDTAYGGAVSLEGGSAAFDHVRFINNSVGGTFGGAIYASQTTVSADCVDLENNWLNGPAGGGVYLDSGSMVFSNSYFGSNFVVGVSSSTLNGPGGNARGGAIYSKGALSVVNSTLCMNRAHGGFGRSPGLGEGGGVYVAAGSASFVCSTLLSNVSVSGIDLFSGPTYDGGQNLYISTNSSASAVGTLIVAGTNILGTNRFRAMLNSVGPITDLGSNLQWPTNDCGPTIPSIDPLLQGPADNGGFVKTAAVASNSPAIGANTTTCLGSDARGVARPSSGCDIGAFQLSSSDPQFLIQPMDSTVGTGTDFQLAGSAVGTGRLSYQWWFNGTAIGGQTNDTLSLTSADQTNAGTYFVIVSNAEGSITSSNAVLQVADAAPSVRYQPTAHIVTSFTNVALFVVADGTPPLSYQWQCNGTNIAGATDQSQSLTNFVVNVGDTFQVVVSNLSGAVTSANAIISEFQAPSIVVQPTDANYGNRFVATFTGQCDGTPPLHYQWTFNGTNIAGATSNTLTLKANGIGYPPLVSGSYLPLLVGTYQLQVSNDYGITLSAPARLDGDPYGSNSVVMSPAAAVPTGGQVTLNAGITSGSEPFTFTWYKNGRWISDAATNASLTLSNVSLSDSGTYSVSIVNQYGFWSEDGVMTVYQPATFLKPPQSIRTNWGSTVTFTCKGGGTPPLHYEWYYQGAALYHDHPTFTIPRATGDDAGQFTVVVSNQFSSVTSAPVAVSFVAKTPHIAVPANNLRTTNDSVLLRGTCATPDDGSTYIWCRDNDETAYPASWSDDLRYWSMQMPLNPGTNVLRVLADTGWEQSPETSVVVFCVRTTQVSIVVSPTNGGKVYPNLHGKVEVGRGYHLTAAPAADYILSNWSGSVSAASRSIDVVMDWDTVIQANFVTNPFPAVAGNYVGLYSESDSVRRDTSGLLLATVDRLGSITLRAINAGPIGFGSGQVEAGGHVHLPISRGGKSWIALDGQLDFASHQITGTLQASNWTAEFNCEKALKPSGGTNVFSGRYTYAIGGGDDAAGGPLGRSVGTAIVGGGGFINATTYFSDRGVGSEIVALTETGKWPFYSRPWNGRGETMGWVSISSLDRTMTGSVTTIRLPIPTALYPAGFTNTARIAGGQYNAADQIVWPAINSKTLTFISGNLSNDFSVVGLNLGTATYHNDTNDLSLSFNSGTGLFAGSFLNPATTKRSTIRAIVLQGLTNVTGFFVGTNGVGLVECR